MHFSRGRDVPYHPTSPGRLLARALAGSWRLQPAPPALAIEELASIVDLCLSSGTGGLIWRRIADTPLATTVGAERLHDMFRLLQIRDGIRAAATAQAVDALRSAGIESIVLKGWSTARLYPDPALRPSGDIDLLVAPESRVKAARVLSRVDERHWADLYHLDIDAWGSAAWPELKARSQVVPFGETTLRVLGPEHQLRLVCAHLLRHAQGEAVRPLWLCDLAVTLESLPGGFDWEMSLGEPVLFRNWAVMLIRLAEHFLQTSVPQGPEWLLKTVPGWMLQSVERQWSSAYLTKPDAGALAEIWASPSEWARGLGSRWPTPLQASLRLGAPPNDLPRLPFQLVSVLFSGGVFVGRLGRTGQREVGYAERQRVGNR